MRSEHRTPARLRVVASAAVGAGVLLLGSGVPPAVAAFADPAPATASFTAATLGRPPNARCTGSSLTTAVIAWDAVPGVDGYIYTLPSGSTETLSASTTTHPLTGPISVATSYKITSTLHAWRSVDTTVTLTFVAGICVFTTT